MARKKGHYRRRRKSAEAIKKKVSIITEIATVRNAKRTDKGKFMLETLIALSFTSTLSVTERQDNSFESECTINIKLNKVLST